MPPNASRHAAAGACDDVMYTISHTVAGSEVRGNKPKESDKKVGKLKKRLVLEKNAVWN